jgi:hypothetical protein
MSLFELPADPVEPVVNLSADRKRTIRRRAMLDAGIHPLMGGAVRADGETCGSCAHHCVQGDVARTYHKCELRNTGGPATDIRVSWPGCYRWERVA